MPTREAWYSQFGYGSSQIEQGETCSPWKWRLVELKQLGTFIVGHWSLLPPGLFGS